MLFMLLFLVCARLLLQPYMRPENWVAIAVTPCCQAARALVNLSHSHETIANAVIAVVLGHAV